LNNPVYFFLKSVIVDIRKLNINKMNKNCRKAYQVLLKVRCVIKLSITSSLN